jgi:N-acetylated-alpha-linked acidic dipeptidase
MLAEAEAVGALARSGWTPRRTIVYAAWDGEEPGLLGSTEWVETHAAELQQKAIAYINSDGNGRGFLGVGGSHGLERFVNEIASAVTDPQTSVSVGERARALAISRARTADDRKEARDRAGVAIGALGSGSDYTPFLQHLGIPSLSIGFGGEDNGGSYHSIYDSITHYERFGDPGFAYAPVLAKVGGRTVLRLADAAWLPIAARPLADTVDKYVQEVNKLTVTERDKVADRNQRIREKTDALAADPTETYVAPAPEPPVPFLNLTPLLNASGKLKAAADKFDQATADPKNLARIAAPDTGARLDAELRTIDIAFTSSAGLPRRPWFKHQIYAPGYYTGYGVKTLPGVREAIEQHAWREAEAQAVVTAEAIGRAADVLDRATAIVAGP